MTPILNETHSIAGFSAAPVRGKRSARWLAAAAFAGCVGLLAAQQSAIAQETSGPQAPAAQPGASLQPQEPLTTIAEASTPAAPAAAGCTGPVDPYKNYACLDTYLGTDVLTRFINYYRLEWGEAAAPSDPNAPPGRRPDLPPTPQTSPPMPFTDWPYGGTENLGDTRPNGADSPLMAAIANTGLGQWMASTNIQLYGWVDAGGNVSSNSVKPGGNAPIGYAYTPNTVQNDQDVVYIDRWPDTVQSDHIDWGFRLSALYGENYRYTTAYGIASYQLLKKNQVNGYDFPMEWIDVFVPQIGQAGTIIRVGRFISLPDIEAQLAPNNYMYTHSLTYTYDNYTNEGIQTTIGITNQFFLQLGVTVGTEAAIWHWNEKIPNPAPNPLFPGNTMLKDPGAQPTGTGCFRWTSTDGDNDLNVCADAINKGNWGYNNLQWYGFTAYHKWNDQWHISFEFYNEHESDVPNANNAAVHNSMGTGFWDRGGTPFSPQYMPFNAPSLAQCRNADVLDCTANSFGTVFYLNYSPDPLDNLSFRPELYWDPQGWRTGVKTTYADLSLGWQHWLSPQIEFRPEIGYWKSLNADAFNGDSNAGIAPNKSLTLFAASDVIVHF